MGFDIGIITKAAFPYRGAAPSNYACVLDRGFCTMLMNAENHPEPVLPELERVLQMDLGFLLKPQYHDLERMQDLRGAFEAHPNYHGEMNYDKRWWQDYFDATLRADVDKVIDYLQAAKNYGIEEFSFDYG